jgi:hypothetical protein
MFYLIDEQCVIYLFSMYLSSSDLTTLLNLVSKDEFSKIFFPTVYDQTRKDHIGCARERDDRKPIASTDKQADCGLKLILGQLKSAVGLESHFGFILSDTALYLSISAGPSELLQVQLRNALMNGSSCPFNEI